MIEFNCRSRNLPQVLSSDWVNTTHPRQAVLEELQSWLKLKLYDAAGLEPGVRTEYPNQLDPGALGKSG